MTETMSELVADCGRIWRIALERMGAANLVSGALEGDFWHDRVRVLALGKAALPMARAALERLGPRVSDALCVAPAAARTAGTGPPMRVLHGGHPVPDRSSAAAGEAVMAWAARDRAVPVLALLSGGASALVVAPAEGVAFEEKVAAVAALMRAGSDIGTLNAVRKHLSRLKGGRLGAALAPIPIWVLVLSDVPGDDVSTIASGPFSPDPTTFAGALGAFESAGVAPPPSVRTHLEAGERGEIDETPKPGDARLASIVHNILAGPVDLASAAAEAGRERGYAAEADPSPLTGSVAALASRIGEWARRNAGRGRRLLAIGGEPEVRVPSEAAEPDGGRAQHLALLAAREIAGLRAAVMAAGSDGRDGPTEQAGAAVDGETVARAKMLGVDLEGALASARSGPACVALGAAIPRAETGTHLGDLVLVAVE